MSEYVTYKIMVDVLDAAIQSSELNSSFIVFLKSTRERWAKECLKHECGSVDFMLAWKQFLHFNQQLKDYLAIY